jgi:type II secretory pathway pseudopilin PulG
MRVDRPRVRLAGLAADAGTSLAELLLVMLIAATTAGITAPVAARVIDAHRAAQGAAGLAAWLRASRHHAVFTGAATGVSFDLAGRSWTIRRCEDANANGLRRAEIASGVDRCLGAPQRVEDIWPGTVVAVNPVIPGPDGSPPATEPVNFGPAALASFNPGGTGTSGTVFLQSGDGLQFAVRVAGATGRVRVLRFDARTGQWKD